MKKLIAIVVLIALCFSFVACDKRTDEQKAQEAALVEQINKNIDALSEITLSKERKITEIREQYDSLSKQAKKDVSNYKTLVNAEKELSDLKVKEAENKIKQIGTISIDKIETIASAREYYDGLTENEQKKVSNYETLKKAENEIVTVQKTYVEDLINAIGTVTLNSGDAIKNAQNALNNANPDIRDQIANKATLTAAVEKYQELRIQQVISAIDAIGTVTLNSKTAIDNAQNLYNKLNESEKKSINNYNVLTQAQQTYTSLQAKAKEQALNAALSKLVLDYDEFKDVKFYNPSTMPRYIDTRSYFLPYIGISSSNKWMRICANYTDDDWIFFENLIILVDGKRYTKSFSYSDIERDNDRGDVWEYADWTATDTDIAMLREIANSSSTKIRFSGNYTYDLTVSSSDKKAIKQVLEAYDLLKS